jgi:hypothetical protein
MNPVDMRSMWHVHLRSRTIYGRLIANFPVEIIHKISRNKHQNSYNTSTHRKVKILGFWILSIITAFLFKTHNISKTGICVHPQVKSTHTGHYLHFKPNHPHHMKRGVIHSLANQVKVICQDQKDFNEEIKNTIHDLTLNKYPQEFVDSIMKPSRSSSPPSDTTYQSTVIIPYVKGLSEKFKRTGNNFIVRTIFKTDTDENWTDQRCPADETVSVLHPM